MNKQVLSPFDCDMCAMIEDITKQEIEVTASDTSIRLSWAQTRPSVRFSNYPFVQ